MVALDRLLCSGEIMTTNVFSGSEAEIAVDSRPPLAVARAGGSTANCGLSVAVRFAGLDACSQWKPTLFLLHEDTCRGQPRSFYQ